MKKDKKQLIKDLKIGDIVTIPNVKGILTIEFIGELNDEEYIIKFCGITYVELLNKYTEVNVLSEE